MNAILAFFKKAQVSMFMIIASVVFFTILGIYLALYFSTKLALIEYKQQYFTEKMYQMSYVFRTGLSQEEYTFENEVLFHKMAKEFGTPVEFVSEDMHKIIYKNGLSHLELTNPYSVELPVVKDGQTLGYLRAYFDMDQDLSSPAIFTLEKKLKDQQRYILLSIGLLVLLISFMIAKYYAEPLKGAAKYAAKILKGNREEFVPRQGTEEVKQLIDSTNSLLIEFSNLENWRKQMMEDLTHELRTPLTSVLTRLEAIIDGVYPKTDKNLQDIYEEVERFSRLIHNVQQLSEAEGARFKLNIKKVNLVYLVKGVYDGFLFIAKQRQIQMHFVNPNTPCTAYIDPDRMIQVITNIISNALKYTPPGGEVWLEFEIGEDDFTFYCQDNGIGISEDELPFVFNRFYRIDKSRSRDYGGSGIGLSISKALVHAHGGEIGVESELEKGSRFWVKIPIDNHLVSVKDQHDKTEALHGAI
ncbi:sensor histidine kinase [Lederbergia ruris]|uniref:sensor histidine kinase n=1 Tax=Lederbergia ruris TaxID=217495 RepID=UPI00130E329D